MDDLQFGYRNGKNGAGELAPLPLRLHAANGAAFVLGYTCPGAYQALHRLADGDRDAKTGQCSSISTQYRIKAIPAFVVDVATHSANERLEKNSHGNEKSIDIDARADARHCRRLARSEENTTELQSQIRN